jgi:hypothetical protein
VVFGFEVPNPSQPLNRRNFKSTTLAGVQHSAHALARH